MGFNRKPHYTRGLLLVGDAGGMVNPFNGEGIAYAMESGELAARVIAQAKARKGTYDRELVLADYPRILSETYGGSYTLGRYFVKLISNPKVMKLATQRGHLAPDADEVHTQAAREPDRPAWRRRDGPHHQRPREGDSERIAAETAG